MVKSVFMDNPKAYIFKEKTDYIFYFHELIVDVIKYKWQLSSYLDKIENLLSENPDKKFIQTEIYESISNGSKSVVFLAVCSKFFKCRFKWDLFLTSIRVIN